MSPKVGVEPLRQAQITEATLRLIARNGSHNVSIQDVASEAGLSKGAVLHYYPTKDKLFATVFKEYFRQVFEQCKATMAEHDEPLEKLRSIGKWLFTEHDPLIDVGYPLYLECMSRALYEENFHVLFQEWVSNWVDLLKAAIEEGIRQGEFNPVHPEDSARAISAFCQGIASRWYLDRKQHGTQWAIQTLIDYTETLLLKEQPKITQDQAR